MRGMCRLLSLLLLAAKASAQNNYYNNDNDDADNNNQNNANQYNANQYNGNYNNQNYANQNYANQYNGNYNNQYNANDDQNNANANQNNANANYQYNANNNQYDDTVENEADYWGGYSNSEWQANDDDRPGMGVTLENCENNPIIEVTQITILCTSPYAYYAGSGNHQNSEFCDYGDHGLVTVHLNVPQGWLSYNSDAIYMTMGVYAVKNMQPELVWAVRSVELCQTFVGHECTAAGSYAFAFRISMDFVMTDQYLFVPQVQVGFSNKRDEGYNLGGVNIDCAFNGDYQAYDPWFVGYHKIQNWGAGTFAAQWGLLLGVGMLLTAFGLFAWNRSSNNIEFTGNSLNEDLMEPESLKADESIEGSTDGASEA
jgi:hypothetical protein